MELNNGEERYIKEELAKPLWQKSYLLKKINIFAIKFVTGIFTECLF